MDRVRLYKDPTANVLWGVVGHYRRELEDRERARKKLGGLKVQQKVRVDLARRTPDSTELCVVISAEWIEEESPKEFSHSARIILDEGATKEIISGLEKALGEMSGGG